MSDIKKPNIIKSDESSLINKILRTDTLYNKVKKYSLTLLIITILIILLVLTLSFLNFWELQNIKKYISNLHTIIINKNLEL